jgi:hypothetical protein
MQRGGALGLLGRTAPLHRGGAEVGVGSGRYVAESGVRPDGVVVPAPESFAQPATN